MKTFFENLLTHLLEENNDLKIINFYLDDDLFREEKHLNEVVFEVLEDSFSITGKQNNEEKFFKFDLNHVDTIQVYDVFGESLGLIDVDNVTVDINEFFELSLTSEYLNERYIITKI